jgi:hypothetical protein
MLFRASNLHSCKTANDRANMLAPTSVGSAFARFDFQQKGRFQSAISTPEFVKFADLLVQNLAFPQGAFLFEKPSGFSRVPSGGRGGAPVGGSDGGGGRGATFSWGRGAAPKGGTAGGGLLWCWVAPRTRRGCPTTGHASWASKPAWVGPGAAEPGRWGGRSGRRA